MTVTPHDSARLRSMGIVILWTLASVSTLTLLVHGNDVTT